MDEHSTGSQIIEDKERSRQGQRSEVATITMNSEDKKRQLSMTDWVTQFSDGKNNEATAELAAKFMFAMSYYHDKMKLHVMLHPFFYVAGFLTAYYLMGK